MLQHRSTAGFASLGVSAEVERSLAARGIVEPFRIQALVVPDALAGRDVLGQAPTGSGKTLAFGLPIVELLRADEPGSAEGASVSRRAAPASPAAHPATAPAALVLVPTRELALQVTEELSLLGAPRGIRAGAAYGGAPVGPQAKRLKGVHVVVATPGRLHDLAQRRLLALDRIRILVLDEADRMLDMGFRPQVERIVRRLPARRQTMLFSATLVGEVGDLARAYTLNPSRFEAELPAQHADDVEHRFVAVTAADKLDRLVELLESERGLALVFVRTKRGADRLAHKLRGRGLDAAAMHGDMTQGAREQALERFRSGKVTTLVATDVAARGLDLEAISHVVNYDPPEDTKGYVHRVGRTGRAGRSGHGVTLVLPEQQAEVSRVASLLGHREEFEETGMKTARPRLVYSSRRGRRSRW